MRHPTGPGDLRAFMQELGSRLKHPVKVYLTGGATCVLRGWRATTIDIDLKPVPDPGEVYAAIAELKEKLSLNIETASPDDFLPPLPGWEERSEFIDKVGRAEFYHYDEYAQALSKIARGFEKDLDDARRMMASRDPGKLRELFEAVRPDLVRYPAVDEKSLLRKLDDFLASHPGDA